MHTFILYNTIGLDQFTRLFLESWLHHSRESSLSSVEPTSRQRCHLMGEQCTLIKLFNSAPITAHTRLLLNSRGIIPFNQHTLKQPYACH